jgi:hypothetical protein
VAYESAKAGTNARIEAEFAGQAKRVPPEAAAPAPTAIPNAIIH